MRQRGRAGRFWAHARKTQPPPSLTRLHPQLRKSIPAAPSTAQRTKAPPSGTCSPMTADNGASASTPARCPANTSNSSADPRLPMIEGDVLGRVQASPSTPRPRPSPAAPTIASADERARRVIRMTEVSCNALNARMVYDSRDIINYP